MDKKIVIIPTYNEKENIENIIRAVFALEGDFHILVIEDGEIIGCGKHEELMATCTEYKEISDSQMGGAFVE